MSADICSVLELALKDFDAMRWLRRRTSSSSTATLSAKMAASVRMRLSSSWVFWRTSAILADRRAR